jgi:hypothetical protein
LKISNCKVLTKKSILALVILFTLLCPFFELKAQTSIPDSLVTERIQCIQKMLDEGKPRANLWWYGWLGGYSAATVGQGIVFSVSEDLKTRQNMALGAATTFVGAIGQLITPMVPAYAPGRISILPEDTPEQRVRKLEKAEQLFAASAQREIFGRSWKMQAASGAVNLSSGLITWLGFDRSVWEGIGNFAFNTAITEIQIYTQPMKAVRDYKKYCEKYKNGLPSTAERPDVHLLVNAFPGGISLRLLF